MTEIQESERVYVIVLEKHDGLFGSEPVGKVVRNVSRRGWANEAEARVRAFNILKRDRPDRTRCAGGSRRAVRVIPPHSHARVAKWVARASHQARYRAESHLPGALPPHRQHQSSGVLKPCQEPSANPIPT